MPAVPGTDFQQADDQQRGRELRTLDAGNFQASGIHSKAKTAKHEMEPITMEPRPSEPIRFDDGAVYERAMGVWSRLAGSVFLDWLDCPPGLRWLDVGCGNGAFTELLLERCAPETQGIDPAPAQVAYAQTRPGAQAAQFRHGDALALPFDDDHFDAAVMALVIFFVPDPAAGVAEMARVVRPGGLVSAYVWDALEGGLPFESLREEMQALGVSPAMPPSVEASRRDVLRGLWVDGGLELVEAREIAVERTSRDFQDFWTPVGAWGASRPHWHGWRRASWRNYKAVSGSGFPSTPRDGSPVKPARTPSRGVSGRLRRKREDFSSHTDNRMELFLPCLTNP